MVATSTSLTTEMKLFLETITLSGVYSRIQSFRCRIGESLGVIPFPFVFSHAFRRTASRRLLQAPERRIREKGEATFREYLE